MSEPVPTPNDKHSNMAALFGEATMSSLGIRDTHSEVDAFEDLLSKVLMNKGSRLPPLDAESRAEFFDDFTNLAHLFAFYEQLDFPFVLALADVKHYDTGAVIDVFSDDALTGLGLPSSSGPTLDRPQDWKSFRPLITQLANQSKIVVRVEPRKAAKDFFELFISALRISVGRSAPSSATVFTVYSNYDGYRVHYFRPYRYKPVVFSAKPSTPTSRALRDGEYCFEGRMAGIVVRDPGRHIADAFNTSTQTTAF